MRSFEELYAPFFESLAGMSALYRQGHLDEAAETLATANAQFENLAWMEAALSHEIEEAQTAERDRVGTVIFVVALIGTLIAGFLVFYLVPHQIVSPVRRVVSELATMAEGDADLTQELPVLSRDEIGVLSQIFNRFLASLEAVVATIRGSVEQQITRQTTGVAETSATVEQVSEMAGGAHRLQEEMRGAMEEQRTGTTQVLESLTAIRDQTSEVREARQRSRPQAPLYVNTLSGFLSRYIA